jgi:hypothetical protein
MKFIMCLMILIWKRTVSDYSLSFGIGMVCRTPLAVCYSAERDTLDIFVLGLATNYKSRYIFHENHKFIYIHLAG